MSTPNVARQPSGTPAGGQFAESAKAAPDPSVALVERPERQDDDLRAARLAGWSEVNAVASHIAAITEHLVAKDILEEVPEAGVVRIEQFSGELEVTAAKYADGEDMDHADFSSVHLAIHNLHADDVLEVMSYNQVHALDINVAEAAATRPSAKPARLPVRREDGKVVVPVRLDTELRPAGLEDLPAWPEHLPEPSVTFGMDDGKVETGLTWGNQHMNFWTDSDDVYSSQDAGRSYDDVDEDDLAEIEEYGRAVHNRVDGLVYGAFVDTAYDSTLNATIVAMATGKEDQS